MNECEIFMEALRQPAPADRQAYLYEACGHDFSLRQRVEALLMVHERAGGFLLSPVAACAFNLEPPLFEKPGSLIGPYKLLEQIGEGGFGIVFLAEQLEPVRRKVALKLIKPGMDTRHVIARFEAERQALALMDHPNIAKVLEASATRGEPGGVGAGRPYFVMELVKGLPITDYCDQNLLSPRQRLELFIPVCQAIQHAHHKGIIHRDLKPSNVLVTLHDGTAVVKVIDFGIAKALGQQLTDKSLHTSFAQLIGTPLYMSPEQAAMSGQDIDTRSDIYSLGVLLYELLTGFTPLGKERFGKAGYDEIRRIVREEEPAKPSARLSTMGEAATVVSTRRQSEPKRLSQLFRRELDWIVMKALEKERCRRYETAAAFGADIQRYLNDEPVSACPPSAWYRFGKLARRNKGMLVTACLVSLALVVGTTVSVWQAIRATEAATSERQALRDLGKEQQATRQALLDLGEEEKATKRELERTQDAEKKATLELFESWVAQARANRLSRRIGQRFWTLDLLRKALGMARHLNLPAERFLELRNEAIAATALPDLRVAREWPDGSRGAVSFDAALERYTRVDQNGKLYVRRAGDGKEIYRLADYGPGEHWPFLSPDGGYLADFDPGSGRLSVWRLAGAEPALVLDEPGLGASCFSPDSRQLALQHTDGSIGVFDLATGAKVYRLPHVPEMHVLRFHPTGAQLALDSPGRLAQVRDLESGKVLWQRNLTEPWPWIGWHPDGKILALSEGDAISFWDVAKSTLVGKLERIHGGGISFIFDPSGTLLASHDWGGILRLWDPRSNRQLFSTPFVAAAFQFSGDGRYLAATQYDSKMRIWEIAAGHEYRTLVASPLNGKRGYVSVSISPEGRFLAAGANGAGGVGLWDLPSGKELAFLEGSPGHNAVLLEPRSPGAPGERTSEGALLTMGVNGLFRWPIRAEQGSSAVSVGPAQRVPVPGAGDGQIAQSRDGRVLAAAQFQGALVLHADQPDQSIKLRPQDDVRYVAVSPDGRWIATGSFSHPGGAKIWKAGSLGKPPSNGLTFKLVKDLPVGGFCRVAFSPDGKCLLTGAIAAVRTVRRWEVETWIEIPFTEPIEGQNPAYSPDGKLLVVETGSGVARLLDAETGREYARLEDPDQHRTNSFAFTPDGMKLVCATSDGYCVHVWDLQAIRRQLADMGLDWK